MSTWLKNVLGLVGMAAGLFFALQLGVETPNAPHSEAESAKDAVRATEAARNLYSENNDAGRGVASGGASARNLAKTTGRLPEIEFQDLNLGASLNDPGKTARDDLALLDSIFSVWQTNFLQQGNPVGQNNEITAALTGGNRLRVAFISPRSAAINTKGELCDRWGTPYVFHQISGARMEIVSAGPDRTRHTSDDVAFDPGAGSDGRM